MRISDWSSDVCSSDLGGTAVIPYDSPHVATLYAKAEKHAARILTFGFDPQADVRARETVPAAGGGTLVTAALPGVALCFTVGAPGEPWVSNALAVLATVEALGGDLGIGRAACRDRVCK